MLSIQVNQLWHLKAIMIDCVIKENTNINISEIKRFEEVKNTFLNTSTKSNIIIECNTLYCCELQNWLNETWSISFNFLNDRLRKLRLQHWVCRRRNLRSRDRPVRLPRRCHRAELRSLPRTVGPRRQRDSNGKAGMEETFLLRWGKFVRCWIFYVPYLN